MQSDWRTVQCRANYLKNPMNTKLKCYSCYCTLGLFDLLASLSTSNLLLFFTESTSNASKQNAAVIDHIDIDSSFFFNFFFSITMIGIRSRVLFVRIS